MRISTSQMYYNGKSNLVNGQADMYKTQNQLSTGREILTPRDNPVDATLALMTEQYKSVNASYMKNQGTASDELKLVDTQLGSVIDIMQRVNELAIQGGNSSYGPQEKAAIVEEMKRHLESLIDLANSRDGNGDAVFGGGMTQVTPFTSGSPATLGNYSSTNSYITYAGDDNRRQLQVEASQVVQTSFSGQDVFMRVRNSSGNSTGKSIFDSVKNMIDSLDPASGVATPPAYTTSVQGIHDSIDHVLRMRANVGATLNQLASLDSAGQDLALQYDTRLSNLTGLDYTEAISRFMQQQTQLQASQQSFAKTSQMSLFEYIS